MAQKCGVASYGMEIGMKSGWQIGIEIPILRNAKGRQSEDLPKKPGPMCVKKESGGPSTPLKEFSTLLK